MRYWSKILNFICACREGPLHKILMNRKSSQEDYNRLYLSGLKLVIEEGDCKKKNFCKQKLSSSMVQQCKLEEDILYDIEYE